MKPDATGLFSPRVEEALTVAMNAHAGQMRKGRLTVPYVVHSIHVALMVSRFSDDEDTFLAAILHDVVEDCDDWSLEDLGSHFGERVAGFVDELSEDKSQTWKVRKDTAIAHVPELSPEAALIKACDKLHNMRSLVRDLEEREHQAVWASFSGGKEGTLSVAQRLSAALFAHVPKALGEELSATVRSVEELAG